MGGTNRQQSLEQDYMYLKKIFHSNSEVRYTIDEVLKCVNNWSMTPITKDIIINFLKK